jgi:hypothetical protein
MLISGSKFLSVLFQTLARRAPHAYSAGPFFARPLPDGALR